MNKNYTSVEQSQKLIKLGIDKTTSDMHYDKHPLENYYSPIPIIGKYSEIHDELPCWSLATLLNVLPVSCDDGQHCLALINHNPNEKTEWLCAYEDDKGNLMMECYADNQIDACYEMILKLHNLKMLQL